MTTAVAPSNLPQTFSPDGSPFGCVSDVCAPCAPSSDGPVSAEVYAEASSGSTNRLAACNDFTINPDEPSRDLQELVQALTEEIEKGKDLNRLYNIMLSYDASGNEWKRYEFVDETKKYTRNLIANVPGVLCLMLLVWNPQKSSPIHNHAGSECFLKVLRGEILERQYVVKNGEGDASAKCNWNKVTCSNVPPSDLIQSHTNVYSAGGCTFINDSLGVHSVENQHSEAAITLHCYIPGYEMCKSWSEDSENKSIKIQQCHISFDTEQGERPNH